MSSELSVVPESRPSLPAPAFSGAEMSTALHAYQEMQQALDAAMPDQLMTIQGRVFRRKGYWRTVARAFRLRVECLKEERISGTEDWGFAVVYRAFTPSGDQADGDGACSASEKHAGNDTLHNVRSHAHTRAYNRAVSNLVGFGEVSAEEMQAARPAPGLRIERDVTPKREEPKGAQNGAISEAQGKRLWAIAAKRAGELEAVSREEIVRDVLALRGIEHTREIPRDAYDSIIEDVTAWEPPVGEAQAASAELF